MLLLIAPPSKSYQASSGMPSWLQPSKMSNDTGHPAVSLYRTTFDQPKLGEAMSSKFFDLRIMYVFIGNSEPSRLSQAYALYSAENILEQAHVSGAYARCYSATFSCVQIGVMCSEHTNRKWKVFPRLPTTSTTWQRPCPSAGRISCNVLFHQLHCPLATIMCQTASCKIQYSLWGIGNAKRHHAFHVSPE